MHLPFSKTIRRSALAIAHFTWRGNEAQLEDAGIPFFVLGQIGTLVQDVDAFLHKWVRVQVPRDREAEARELMADLLQAETRLPADGDYGAAEPGQNA